MMERQRILHPFEPVFNGASKVLILGSLPSVASRQDAFYYGHPRNRFWRVLADVTNQPLPNSIVEKKNLLLGQRIALWDVVSQCDITGSADTTIKNVRVNDISSLLSLTSIGGVYVNGRKAYELYKRYCENNTGLKAICLPSTSPANALYDYQTLLTNWMILREALYE